MWTCYQLIQKINTEYPNNGFVYDAEVTPETRVEQAMIDYINSAMSRCDKVAYLDEEYDFPTIERQSVYELPIDCPLNNIMEVSRIYDKIPIRLRWARDGEIMVGNRYFNAYGNMIGIFPTPQNDNERIFIAYKHAPRPVKTVDDPIEIEDSLIDLIVYSVVADIAAGGSNPDIEVSNNYRDRYNALLQDALLKTTTGQPYYPKCKDNLRPPLSWLRRG